MLGKALDGAHKGDHYGHPQSVDCVRMVHKVRNIVQKVSPPDQAAVKADVQAAYYASRP